MRLTLKKLLIALALEMTLVAAFPAGNANSNKSMVPKPISSVVTKTKEVARSQVNKWRTNRLASHDKLADMHRANRDKSTDKKVNAGSRFTRQKAAVTEAYNSKMKNYHEGRWEKHDKKLGR
ncbi:hypothetical protein IWQ62_005319 [Dispira parvispora]|uniref:Uncharacterized protein n=1 Tax=Dispira parvispora TaxID=1520584 RepID=A0A9W8AK82_9FUNG|nr:hypothetical protein IWQ62_005319 [Dispira parvispora]